MAVVADREVLDLEVGSGLLAELAAHVKGAERLLAAAVGVAGRLAGSGVAERVEGLTLDLVLATGCGLTGADRGAILTAGETLRSLPITAGLFAEGVVSWGQVRRIVASVRRIAVADRAVVDARIGAAHREHGIDAYNPDDLCDQVDVAVDALRAARNVERAEARKARGEFLSLQSDLDGGMKIYGLLGPVSAAIFCNALTQQANQLDADADADADADRDTDGDGHGAGAGAGAGGVGEPGVWTGPSRSKAQARALVALAVASLAGMFADGTPRPAKPLFVCHIPLGRVERTAAGVVVLDVPGMLPTLTARLVEQLAADATLQAVIFDEHRPLAVAAKLHATDIPDDVRLAAQARDLGNVDPGQRLPLGRCHLHHLVHREHGGTNAIDNLVHTGAAWHLRHVHTLGWQGRIDPATGITLWTRRDTTLRQLPRATPLPPPDHPPDGDPRGGDPPGTDPPTTARGNPPGADPPDDPTPPGMPF
jgi:hypothetical protein